MTASACGMTQPSQARQLLRKGLRHRQEITLATRGNGGSLASQHKQSGRLTKHGPSNCWRTSKQQITASQHRQNDDMQRGRILVHCNENAPGISLTKDTSKCLRGSRGDFHQNFLKLHDLQTLRTVKIGSNNRKNGNQHQSPV